MRLANANTQRTTMIVRRIKALKQQGKDNDQVMLLLENMYADSKSNIETLLSTAKALKPDQAQRLPYNSDMLLAQSIAETEKNATNEEP